MYGGVIVSERRVKSGDRFIVIRRDGVCWGGPQVGDIGTVLWVPDNVADDIRIRWDNYLDGHTCGGRCEDGHGWNFNPCHIGDLIDFYEEAPDIAVDNLEDLL